MPLTPIIEDVRLAVSKLCPIDAVDHNLSDTWKGGRVQIGVAHNLLVTHPITGPTVTWEANTRANSFERAPQLRKETPMTTTVTFLFRASREQIAEHLDIEIGCPLIVRSGFAELEDAARLLTATDHPFATIHWLTSRPMRRKPTAITQQRAS